MMSHFECQPQSLRRSWASALLVRLAERAMLWGETEKPSWSNGAELNEIIRHPKFREAMQSERSEFLLRSAKAKYDSEIKYPWDRYFGTDLRPLLKRKRVLDVGSLYGGRTVAWAEKYGTEHITGIDVNEQYLEAARIFAENHGVAASFKLAFAEKLPFESESFDAIVSFDVFEHVQSVRATMRECRRVLKKGGLLYVVFPSYWQPLEHHLSLVTRTPGLQFFFSGATLVEAYNNLVASRGKDADWYKRLHRELKQWERCNTINGTSLRLFRAVIREGHWRVVKHSRPPIGSIGRTIQRERRLWHRALGTIGAVLVHVPVIDEAFLHRIVFILQRD